MKVGDTIQLDEYNKAEILKLYKDGNGDGIVRYRQWRTDGEYTRPLKEINSKVLTEVDEL